MFYSILDPENILKPGLNLARGLFFKLKTGLIHIFSGDLSFLILGLCVLITVKL